MASSFPLALAAKQKEDENLEGLPQFKWEQIGNKDIIGQGGFGAVFITEFKSSPRSPTKTVVVKQLLKKNRDISKLFLKEARLLHEVNHKSIVRFEAMCNEPHALMLEYVYFELAVFGIQGKVSSLDDLLSFVDKSNCEGIAETFMQKIAHDIARGLQYLHDKDIVHRDLKPENVLVSNHHYRGETDRQKLNVASKAEPLICKLTDFGFSRSQLIQTLSVCFSRTDNVTRGTYPYMAPEILLTDSEVMTEGATIEDLKLVDMWAYGMVLFAVINPCLQFPFEIDIERRTGPRTDDAKEIILDFFKKGMKPAASDKYSTRQQSDWVNIWKMYDACTNYAPRKRPRAAEVIDILQHEMEKIKER